MIIPILRDLETDALIHFSNKVLRPEVQTENEDGSTDWSPKKLSPGEAQHAVTTVCRWLSTIPGGVAQDRYVEDIFKMHSKLIGKKKNLQDEIARLIDEGLHDDDKTQPTDKAWKLPKGINREDVYRDGFYQYVDGPATGIYFRTGDTAFTSVSNVCVEPLFHNMSDKDDSRIVKITDGMSPALVIELPSDALLNRDAFRKFLFKKGPYFFDGNQTHLDKINKALLYRFPKAYKLNRLGWQPEGFFAYYNIVFYQGQILNYNEAGLVEVNGAHFYSPAVSDMLKIFRQEDDDFENERLMQYVPPPIDFNTWLGLVAKAYPDHFYLIITGVMLSLFRDVYFKIDRNCPHIFFYGPTDSGKTKAAQAITDLFFKEMKGFVASTGTDAAFGEYFGRYMNVPVILNEFDVHRISPERFNITKNIYEGEGRSRMGGEGYKKSETQKVTSVPIIVSQFLPMIDDGSLPNRCLTGYFPYRKSWPKAQSEAWKKLKEYAEQTGLGGLITFLMPFREMVEKDLATTHQKFKNRMAEEMEKKGIRYRARILQNHCIIPAFFELFEPHFTMPGHGSKPGMGAGETAYRFAFKEVETLSEMMVSQDLLQEFWSGLETLVDRRVIRQNEHFRREEVSNYTVTVSKKTETRVLPERRWIMYINLATCLDEYNAMKRSSNQPPLDKNTFESYLKDRDYYLGYKTACRFTRKVITDPVNKITKTFSATRNAWIIDVELAGVGGLFTDMDLEQKETPKPDEQQQKAQF